MENTPHLYNTLVHVLSQHAKWVDQRHLKTLAWMMVGLIHSGCISLSAWAPHVVSRAQYAQSTARRFRRWLDNDRIDVLSLYGPLMQQALVGWGAQAVYVALDTSMLWNTYCLIRLSVIYRGRAVPLVWCVLQHGSAQVGFDAYQELLTRAALLLPRRCSVVFLADRGFADTDLMAHLQRLGWHWRIRIKSSFWLYRRGHRRCKVERLSVARGHACFWHQVYLTEKRYGPVHLAVARPWQGQDVWYVLSDEPTDEKTFKEYGLRFDIEENFLDDKSNGFQLESSLIRSAQALTRLCLVLAMTTCYLVSQGVEVVKQGKRRWVDPVWSKNSYGFACVVFQEPPEPFMTLHRACTLCVLTDHRKEQDIAFALMISLVMIMGAIGCREPFVQNFRQDAYPSRAVSAGENRSSSTIGWGT